MFAIKGTTSFTRRLSRRRAPSAQIDQQTPANAARSDDTLQASAGQAIHGIPPPIPAIWKQDNGAPFPSPILNDDVSGLSRASGRDYGFHSSKATDQYLHPLYGNSSRSGAGETASDADREFLTLTLPTPDTLPTFTAPDWTGETTPKLRTFSLRSSISHTSWKSWNNDRRVDSAHQGPNSERRTFSMRSLSRRLSIRNDVNHRGVSSVTVENPQKDLHEITPPSKESDSEHNAQREDAEFLSLLKDSRVTPEPSQLTITPAATAIDHENGGRSRPKSIAIHAAARTSTISLALYQPHEDDWVRQIELTDGTGVDEKCLAIELEDDKIPVIPEEQPITTPEPNITTNAAGDAPAGLLTSSNLRALDTITADSPSLARAAAKDKDLPDLPLPAYPPTSDGGSSTLSATHRQHQNRIIKHKASTIKKSHHGSVAAGGHHLRHNSAHHARSRSSTTLFLSLVSRRNTVTDTKPPATAAASNSNNDNNKNDEGHAPAPTLLSRVPSMLLSRSSTLRTAIRPSSRSRRSALNPYSTKAKPIKPVPLATINRRCQAYSSNDPVQAYLCAQERVGAWVATQEGLVEWFRKEGRWEEYMRTKREEKERRKMREMEEEQERVACAKWRLRRWLSEDHGSQEGGMDKARQGSVDVDADVVDGMVEWPEEGIWDGFVSGKKIEAEE